MQSARANDSAGGKTAAKDNAITSINFTEPRREIALVDRIDWSIRIIKSVVLSLAT
jgi:hypothetical protein